MSFDEIDTMLKSLGFKRELNGKPSGKGTTICFVYRKEDHQFRFNVTVQCSPTEQLIQRLLEGSATASGGSS